MNTMRQQAPQTPEPVFPVAWMRQWWERGVILWNPVGYWSINVGRSVSEACEAVKATVYLMEAVAAGNLVMVADRWGTPTFCAADKPGRYDDGHLMLPQSV